MRILFVTNYYPPCQYGWGYMQLCEEVADGLAAKGHDVAVLTSTYRQGDEISRAYPVHRLLTIEPDWHCGRSAALQFFIGRRRRERYAVRVLDRLVADFRPEVIFVWHAIGLSRAMLSRAEQTPGLSVVYYLAGYLPELPDEYVAYWQAPPSGLAGAIVKRTLGPLALRILAAEGKPIRLQYAHVLCVSDFVRRHLLSEGLVEHGVVVHNGVDLSVFDADRYETERFRHGLRCIIAGRVCAEKGVSTAIEALGLLAEEGNLAGLSLTVLGSGPDDYVSPLKDRVESLGLDAHVTFLEPVPRARMPEILAQYDVLLLPSEYQEPLARSMQEGMAMGLLVIGTTTGGSGELLVDGDTGLVFEPGDAGSLARQLGRAVADPDLCRRLADRGYEVVRACFDIKGTVAGVERYLVQTIQGLHDV